MNQGKYWKEEIDICGLIFTLALVSILTYGIHCIDKDWLTVLHYLTIMTIIYVSQRRTRTKNYYLRDKIIENFESEAESVVHDIKDNYLRTKYQK